MHIPQKAMRQVMLHRTVGHQSDGQFLSNPIKIWTPNRMAVGEETDGKFFSKSVGPWDPLPFLLQPCSSIPGLPEYQESSSLMPFISPKLMPLGVILFSLIWGDWGHCAGYCTWVARSSSHASSHDNASRAAKWRGLLLLESPTCGQGSSKKEIFFFWENYAFLMIDCSRKSSYYISPFKWCWLLISYDWRRWEKLKRSPDLFIECIFSIIIYSINMVLT